MKKLRILFLLLLLLAALISILVTENKLSKTVVKRYPKLEPVVKKVREKIKLDKIKSRLSNIPVFGFSGNKEESNEELLKSTKPIRKSVVEYVNSSGKVKAIDEIVVGSLVAGKVEKIIADDNDKVKKGDLLCIIDNGIGNKKIKMIEAAVKELKATLEYKEAILKKHRKLFSSEVITEELMLRTELEYKTTKARLEKTEAELALAQQEYENLFIRAPVDGIVIARMARLGEGVTTQLNASKLYIMSSDLTKMEVVVDVDEADIGKVRIGQPAHFYVDSYPDKKYSSKVTMIQHYSTKINNLVTYKVKIHIDNRDLSLKSGMTANVYIKAAESENALLVPTKSLRIKKSILKKAAEAIGATMEIQSKKGGDRDEDSQFEEFERIKKSLWLV
jgi:HlyD family secretion protein